jgi:hypothetical protein
VAAPGTRLQFALGEGQGLLTKSPDGTHQCARQSALLLFRFVTPFEQRAENGERCVIGKLPQSPQCQLRLRAPEHSDKCRDGPCFPPANEFTYEAETNRARVAFLELAQHHLGVFPLRIRASSGELLAHRPPSTHTFL